VSAQCGGISFGIGSPIDGASGLRPCLCQK
jgi:hypothetical protein